MQLKPRCWKMYGSCKLSFARETGSRLYQEFNNACSRHEKCCFDACYRGYRYRSRCKPVTVAGDLMKNHPSRLFQCRGYAATVVGCEKEESSSQRSAATHWCFGDRSTDQVTRQRRAAKEISTNVSKSILTPRKIESSFTSLFAFERTPIHTANLPRPVDTNFLPPCNNQSAKEPTYYPLRRLVLRSRCMARAVLCTRSGRWVLWLV